MNILKGARVIREHERVGNRGRNTFMGNTRNAVTQRRELDARLRVRIQMRNARSPCRMRVMDIWVEDGNAAHDLSVPHLNALIIHFTRGGEYTSRDRSSKYCRFPRRFRFIEFPSARETIVG